MRLVTLCFLHQGDQVLLGMKKRGFGAGKWNGIGGGVHVALGETIEDAARREVMEEIGVTVRDLDQMALLHFESTGRPDDTWQFECHVFVARAWEGEPVESDEMRPQWFAIDAVPFDEMWLDDRFWLPRVLQGERLEATFVYKDGVEITRHDIRPMPWGAT